jgi:hypothetical protein
MPRKGGGAPAWQLGSSFPFERALLPFVDEADDEDGEEDIIAQKPNSRSPRSTMAHGKRKAISRSNRMKRMATR